MTDEETKKKKRDVSKFLIMAKKCSSCPFRQNENGRFQYPELANRITKDVVTNGSQICHHPRLMKGKKETHLCRGARDHQLTIFHRLGVLDAPTDEAWNEALDRTKERT